ncbi:MAG: OadG family protein [Oscillospiraceae bacterium]|jgi:sodium pump decarboxylase gamma subunit|nr:OadG family protein [Oscillospiraceae bacterium]
MENWFVVVLGLAAVFVVLFLIILLCYLLPLISKAGAKKEEDAQPAAPVADAAISNRAQFIAAVSAAIAEYSGTDSSGIRIVSVKKL